jgi:hypothetical protein
MALDAHLPLLEEIAECQESVDYWKKRQAKLEETLAALLGDSELGTVNGEKVVTFKPVDRFKGAEFAKQYPDLSQAYMHEETKRVVDVQLLRIARPDLYSEFCSRPLSVTYKRPARKPSA